MNELSSNHLCRSCGKSLHTKTLDLGLQPLCNRFMLKQTDTEYTHNLTLGVCLACGIMQILDPPPVAEVAPRFPWIMYNEPETHLDQLADILLGVVASKSSTVIAGVSYKDDTTLERLRRRGIELVWRIAPVELGVDGSRAEIETVQEKLSPEISAAIGKRHGYADIVVARHILEHAHDVKVFLESLKILMKSEGIIVFEVPDCTSVLTLKDYSTIWEEHVLYFTPATLRACLESNDFEILQMENYAYPLENSLVVIARQQKASHILPLPKRDRVSEINRVLDYFESFSLERNHYQQTLAECRKLGNKVVLFGAGHLACAFLNLLGLEGYIEYILDDDPNRQGLFMPGSRLAIKSSASLYDQGISICLLSLNPSNEDRVISRNRNFVERGGEFMSIFPASGIALRC